MPELFALVTLNVVVETSSWSNSVTTTSPNHNTIKNLAVGVRTT
jgi:hypothetical protein